MKYLAVFVTCLVKICFSELNAEEVLVYRTTTMFENKSYEYILYASRLDKTPSWRDDQDNPPLSVRKAISSGKKYLEQIVKDSEKWEVEQITLITVGSPYKWIYIIDVRPPGRIDGRRISSKIIVLMDGTTLTDSSAKK